MPSARRAGQILSVAGNVLACSDDRRTTFVQSSSEMSSGQEIAALEAASKHESPKKSCMILKAESRHSKGILTNQAARNH